MVVLETLSFGWLCERVAEALFGSSYESFLERVSKLVSVEKDSLDAKVDRLVHQNYLSGGSQLEIARAVAGNDRKEAISKARDAFIAASHVEILDLRAKACFFVAVSSKLLEHEAVACDWFERAFQSGLEYGVLVLKTAKKRGWVKKGGIFTLSLPAGLLVAGYGLFPLALLLSIPVGGPLAVAVFFGLWGISSSLMTATAARIVDRGERNAADHWLEFNRSFQIPLAKLLLTIRSSERTKSACRRFLEQHETLKGG